MKAKRIRRQMRTYSIVEQLLQLVFQSFCYNDKKAANSTYLVQFATISRSQIYPGEFLKFTSMLSILESIILHCNFVFSFKMAASSCCQNVNRID